MVIRSMWKAGGIELIQFYSHRAVQSLALTQDTPTEEGNNRRDGIQDTGSTTITPLLNTAGHEEARGRTYWSWPC